MPPFVGHLMGRRGARPPQSLLATVSGHGSADLHGWQSFAESRNLAPAEPDVLHAEPRQMWQSVTKSTASKLRVSSSR
jgi:hypothetical protein